jgi:Na+-driven multidrug efflux pump
VGERVLVLSVVVGIGVSAVVVVTAPLVARAFSADSAVVSRTAAGLVVLGLLLLPGAVAFALDGVLIGAGDVRFLGRAMVIALAIYLPLAAVPLAWPALGIVGVWAALAVWMVARAVLMNRRFRGIDWAR